MEVAAHKKTNKQTNTHTHRVFYQFASHSDPAKATEQEEGWMGVNRERWRQEKSAGGL